MKILFVIKEHILEQKLKEIIKDLKIISRFRVKEDLSREDFENQEIIISVGGDGTFLSAAHFIHLIPILGVNSDKTKSEGALTSVCLEDLKEKLKKILSNQIQIKEYTRERVMIFRKNHCTQAELALNETYIGNVNPHHPSNYLVKFKEKEEIQRSSGIVIATGTGSTAWYKAMGGKPFDREDERLRFKVREPYSGRIHKTMMIDGEIKRTEVLIIEYMMNHGILAIDSIRTYDLCPGDKIEISIGTALRVIQ
jgi:NAD kinase